MTKNFAKTISKYQTSIKKELEIFFDKEFRKNNPLFFLKTLEKFKEFSLRPAKRIRAILVICGYLLSGGKNKKEIFKTSIFVELIHNFLLIHDDILDREELRRGKPSLHRIYQEELGSKNCEEKQYNGMCMAIVAGDMMEFLARQILSNSKFSTESKVEAIKKLDQILIFTAYGEMFEFWLRKNSKGKAVKEKDILEIYKNKTAYYTFIGPLQMGALLAGAATKTLLSLEKIGLPLGIAFQIEDDIEDIASDIKEEQPSLLTFKTINECKKISKNYLTQAKKAIFATKFSEKEKQFLLDLADYIGNK